MKFQIALHYINKGLQRFKKLQFIIEYGEFIIKSDVWASIYYKTCLFKTNLLWLIHNKSSYLLQNWENNEK